MIRTGRGTAYVVWTGTDLGLCRYEVSPLGEPQDGVLFMVTLRAEDPEPERTINVRRFILTRRLSGHDHIALNPTDTEWQAYEQGRSNFSSISPDTYNADSCPVRLAQEALREQG